MSTGLAASTVTPGSAAPDESLTRPAMVPLPAACAHALTGSRRTHHTTIEHTADCAFMNRLLLCYSRYQVRALLSLHVGWKARLARQVLVRALDDLLHPRAIDADQPAFALPYLPVHEHPADVADLRRAEHRRQQVLVAREHEVVQIQQDDVGTLARREAADLVFEANRPGAPDRRRFEHLPMGDQRGLAAFLSGPLPLEGTVVLEQRLHGQEEIGPDARTVVD